jgi:hypothetical protein
MTVLGVFFIPVILFCFLSRPLYLLPLLMVASVFEAGSVINGQIGDFEFGVSPFFLTEIFIALRLLMVVFGPGKLIPQKGNPVRPIAWILLAAWFWCFCSAFIMPRLFAGTLVSLPRSTGEEDFAPLRWSLSNLAQAGYLTLNVCAVAYALHRVRTRRQTEQLMKALYVSVFIVAIIGFSQFLAAAAGLDFPYEVFNSNPSYAQGIDQDIAGFRRVNSTFEEPSYAGSYLAAVTCGMFATYLAGKRNSGSFLALVGVTAALFLTTSSTGFASLAIGSCVLLVFFNPFRKQKNARKTSFLSWMLILGVFAVVGGVLYFTPDLLDAVQNTTVEKAGSYSFWYRLASDIHALEITLQTYGLGVGLGANRASGLIPTMLSSIGVIGTLLFAAMLYKIIRAFPGRSARSSLQMGFWALLTMIISEAVAVPDLNRPTLWALLLLVLTQLNVDLDPRRRSLKPVRLRPLAVRVRPLRSSPRIAPASG